MQAHFNRRTATKVKDGRVQRKNRHRPTGHNGYVVDRESPGRGFRHVVTKQDVHSFIELVPEWERFSERLERIRLAGPVAAQDALYVFYDREETGAILLHAWPEDLWMDLATSYFEAHRSIFERLGVSYDVRENSVFCRFTEEQARAFMLLHVFMHGSATTTTGSIRSTTAPRKARTTQSDLPSADLISYSLRTSACSAIRAKTRTDPFRRH